LRNTPAIGRISAITDPAVLAADPSRDTMLEPGDVIFIPQRPSTVAVLGQVMQPGNMMYNPKFTAADYIARAGGYGRFADNGRTFLVLPDGTAEQVETSWLNLDSQKIPPGSTLVVPRDITPFDLRQLLLDSVSVLSSLAVSAASLAVISRNN
jgi:polysaccharide export outer membrane protein